MCVVLSLDKAYPNVLILTFDEENSFCSCTHDSDRNENSNVLITFLLIADLVVLIKHVN